MKASSLSFKAAVIFALAGMSWGIIMAASHNHATLPAHAHLNLLGWVSLFLFGIYYRLNPALDESRAALVQVGVWIIGTLVLASAVGVIYSGHPDAEPVAIVGSFAILADMIFFAVLVFRPQAKASKMSNLAPAE